MAVATYKILDLGNNLEAREIKEIILGILKAGFPIVAEPEELKYNSKAVVDAQFSIPFGAAVAILYGRAEVISRIRSIGTAENISGLGVLF